VQEQVQEEVKEVEEVQVKEEVEDVEEIEEDEVHIPENEEEAALMEADKEEELKLHNGMETQVTPEDGYLALPESISEDMFLDFIDLMEDEEDKRQRQLRNKQNQFCRGNVKSAVMVCEAGQSCTWSNNGGNNGNNGSSNCTKTGTAANWTSSCDTDGGTSGDGTFKVKTYGGMSYNQNKGKFRSQFGTGYAVWEGNTRNYNCCGAGQGCQVYPQMYYCFKQVRERCTCGKFNPMVCANRIVMQECVGADRFMKSNIKKRFINWCANGLP
jgi:hypothetical protein